VQSTSTSQLLGHIEVAMPADVDFAVASARAAFHGPWSTFTGAQRATCLLKLADLCEEILPQIAELETLTMGTPIAAQKGRLAPNMVKTFRYYAAKAHDALKGESLPIDGIGGPYRVSFPGYLSLYRPKRGNSRCTNPRTWSARSHYVAVEIVSRVVNENL
jgi:acyl-CoA reductase-like NAD-dependent aldehyde dehydrogenase